MLNCENDAIQVVLASLKWISRTLTWLHRVRVLWVSGRALFVRERPVKMEVAVTLRTRCMDTDVHVPLGTPGLTVNL